MAVFDRRISFLTALAMVLMLGLAASEAQDSTTFNALDYQNDIEKGFRVADQLILAADRDKTGLQKSAAIRMRASFLTNRHKQVGKLFSITNDKDVWEKRRELFLKYLAPIIDSPDKYLRDPELANTYLEASEHCCTYLIFDLGDSKRALAIADKVHKAISSSNMVPAQRKLMFDVTRASILHDSDHYDRADELLLRITSNIQLLMDCSEGKDRLATEANLILPSVAAQYGPENCRKIAEDLIRHLESKYQDKHQQMLQRCRILQAESYAYQTNPHEEPADRWLSSVKKLLESQFDPAILSSKTGLTYEMFILQSKLIEQITPNDIDLAIEECNRTISSIKAAPDFNTVNTETCIIEMAGRIISELSRRDDKRARKLWKVLHSFLEESRVKFGDRKPIEHVIDQHLKRIKSDYRLFETRESILGKPAPAFAAGNVIYQGTSKKMKMPLDDFGKKVILLEFWNVDCRPCVSGFPHLTKLEEKYGKRGLVVIGVTPVKQLRWDETTDSIKKDKSASVEDESKALVNFARKTKATHRFLLVEGKEHEKICEAYGVVGNPAAFLIDRKGNVRKSALGSDQIQSNDFEEMIKSLLDEQ